MKNDHFKHRVAGILLDGMSVLIHKSLVDSYWSLPGGKIRLGETSQETLVREMLEETGAQVQIGRLLWVSENIYSHNNEIIHEIAFYYLMTATREAQSILFTDHFYGIEAGKKLFFQWVALDTLQTLEIYPVFLKENLKHLPDGVEHIVYRSEGGA